MITQKESMMFRYIMNVKLNAVKGKTSISSLFPNVEDLMFQSKKFDDLEVAIHSLNQLNTEIAISLNKAVNEERYGIISELNPKHSGEETKSKDWNEDEFAKVWIIDKIQQEENPKHIKAVSLAQVLETHGEPEMVN